MARLRSRIGWLKEGDTNTRLFHRHARHRKKRNFIPKLKDEENILINHEKAASIFDFYSNLIGANSDWSRTVNLDSLDIPRYDRDALDIPFSEEEVLNTIKNLPSDEAPRPHGFTIKFYKTCWAVIKGDLMAVWG